MTDSFKAKTSLTVGSKTYTYFALKALEPKYSLSRLPYSIKVLLENLLRHEDGVNTTKDDVETLAGADFKKLPQKDINFTPARVILQDFTGVPCVVDLAAMRDAIKTLGGDAAKVNPLCPVELVIDHSVMIDHYGSKDALDLNAKVEFQRNEERYTFLRWGQEALKNFKAVPPDTGIVHQVNIEYLARVVFENDSGMLYPDSCFGTDSHTTMVNGIGVLGWGVGGIEAEAAMLGQPSSMLIPEVIGVKVSGKLAEGATATDLVLTVTEMLRKRGVVEKFVEFFGPGLANLSASDRNTIANMGPEYGATCGIFPIDSETLNYLRLTGRSEQQIAVVEAYAKAQGMWWTPDAPEAEYTDVMTLDLGSIKPSLAGPKRPQDRVLLTDVKANYRKAFEGEQKLRPSKGPATVTDKGNTFELKDGAVMIAAITSCTNTSNPSVLIGAGLLARKARALGLKSKPWVKTSLAPGSLAVTEYLQKAGLIEDLESLGFYVTAYGCTTCIGNSGPLNEPLGKAISDNTLSVSAVLSGNRNFEGRVHQDVRMNYLASPPLVVAYAIAGSTDVDLTTEPLGKSSDGKDVFLKDIWPTNSEIQELVAKAVTAEGFKKSYADVLKGDARWQSIKISKSETYPWDSKSTYIANPPYFVGMTMTPPGIQPIKGARALAVLGDSITTDHISPAGDIKKDGPAGKFLEEHGVNKVDFNSFGSRRGNHEIMMRGTFANTRIKNTMTPGVEGGVSRHFNGVAGPVEPIYDVAMKYQKEGIPLVVLAGKEYGTGSSRDWAAKGTILLGVKAVISESFERIHRANLVGMGVLPLNFVDGQSAVSLGLDGSEVFDFDGLNNGATEVSVTAKKPDGKSISFKAKVRINTPMEWQYYNHGGVLQYMLRQMAKA
ncbi:aconitate hydratase AcnA [Stenotrophobium rhamnosiphilum]|uniref:Aconitate hydratase n=1 Tax=Stenotrophobium rhamnosiphilum TaxID=2029166 RepID=A0A2T5MH93_9GAMM|nr:aconitate hydratase AcnA [Stenotrophobium rhamnosiphilum]PTU31933.1 aconitate hydratase AcnA [Stenotrophobium rhamnosiphilum]